MQAVLMSIQPKWCELIVTGKKTVEVRKTTPKLKPPFKVYIYCTADTVKRVVFDEYGDRQIELIPQRIIGEFVCEKLCWVLAHPSIFAGHPMFFQKSIDDACLTQEEVEAYSKGKDVFGWVISQLKIYEKPKELREFQNPCKEYQRDNPQCGNCDFYRSRGEYPAECACEGAKPIVKAPQSWCYVEELK